MISRKFKKILSILKSQISGLISISLFEGLEMITSILLIYMTQKMIDCTSGLETKKLFDLLPYIVALVIGEIFLLRIYQFLQIKLKSNFAYNIRKEMCKKELYCNLYTKNNKNTSHFITTYNTSVDLLTNIVTNYSSIVIYPISLIIASVYFIMINPVLFVASVILIPASSIIYDMLSSPIQKKQKEIIKKRTDIANLTKDTANGFYTVKAYQAEEYFTDKFSNEVELSVKLEKDVFRIRAALQRMFIVLRYIPQLTIPLLGGYMAYKGYITVGELVAATSIIFKIIEPIEKILEIITQTKQIKPICEDIEEILDYAIEESQESNIADSEYALQVSNLSFSYDDKAILDNINLQLKKNSHTIILGESGSGKSTFIKNIMGFFPSHKGEINVNGTILSPSTQKAIRHNISYVPQNPYIFNGTIAENIAMRFFNGEKIDSSMLEQIKKAAVVAQADGFIEGLPNKYNTAINQDVKLSGGQAQRIAIARGVYRNCELFVLDEPTSALDNENEMNFVNDLHKILENKTSIMITHKKEIIKPDDNVIEMEGGKLCEAK